MTDPDPDTAQPVEAPARVDAVLLRDLHQQMVANAYALHTLLTRTDPTLADQALAADFAATLNLIGARTVGHAARLHALQVAEGLAAPERRSGRDRRASERRHPDGDWQPLVPLSQRVP